MTEEELQVKKDLVIKLLKQGNYKYENIYGHTTPEEFENSDMKKIKKEITENDLIVSYSILSPTITYKIKKYNKLVIELVLLTDKVLLTLY